MARTNMLCYQQVFSSAGALCLIQRLFYHQEVLYFAMHLVDQNSLYHSPRKILDSYEQALLPGPAPNSTLWSDTTLHPPDAPGSGS